MATPLNDDDYTLIEGAGCFTVKGFMVRIHSTEEGVAVEIFDAKDAAQGDNKDARLARTYAYDIDCKPASTA